MEKYNVAMILEHAQDIEDVGQKFYTMLSEKMESPELKKIFAVMSRQENNHKEIFSKMQSELQTAPADTSADSELFDFNRHEIIEEKIFNHVDILRKTSRIFTLGDALALMIEIEINSVDYYENIRKLVRAQDQPVMERIINEEKSHVRRLVDLRTEYKTTRIRH